MSDAAASLPYPRRGDPESPKPARNPWLSLLALTLGASTVMIVQTLVLPVLPDIGQQLEVSTTDTIWVLTVNLLAATVFSPLVGRLGDAYGRKKVMAGAIALVVVGSLVAALAHVFWLLLLGRVLQGTAFGVIALAISIIRDTFPPEKVSLGIALLSAIMGIGGGAGLVLAGLLAEIGDFRAIFWVATAASAVGLVLILTFVPESSVRAERSFDIAGGLALGGWLICVLLGIDRGTDWGWSAPAILGLFAGAVVLFAAWILIERRVRVPLVDLQVLTRPVVLGTNITGLLIGLGMFGAFTLINQYVQTPPEVGYGFGADALEAGLTLLPMTAGSLVSAPLASVLINRLSPKVPLAVGSAIAALGFGALAMWHTEQWHFYVITALLGLGVGQAMAAMPAMLNLGVPPEQTGIANGMNSTLRELGSSTGSAVAGATLAANVIGDTDIPSQDAFRIAFILAAVACFVGMLAAVLIPIRRAAAAVAAEEEEDITAHDPAEPVTAEHALSADAAPNGTGSVNGSTLHTAPLQAPSADEPPGAVPQRTAQPAAATGAATLATRPGEQHRPAAAGPVITGTIRGTEHAPLGRATLTLISGDGRQCGHAVAHADGGYEVDAPGPGKYVLIAAAGGYQPHAASLVLTQDRLEFDITLGGNSRLVGTVFRRGEHTPVSSATVIVTDDRGEVLTTSVTDRDGSFSVHDLTTGTFTLVVQAAGHQPTAQQVEIDAGSETTPVAVELTPSARVQGVIRAGTARALMAEAHVTLADTAGNLLESTTSDPDGGYSFTNLSPGRYTVTASSYPTVTETLTIDESGSPTYDLDLHLRHAEG